MPEKRDGSDLQQERSRSFNRPFYVAAISFLAVILALFLYFRTNPAVTTFTYTHLSMDTFVEIRFQARSTREAERIRDSVFLEIERLEKIFSRSEVDSEVAAVNRAAGVRAVHVSPETFHVVERALYFACLTEGAFDPTVGSLVDLWGFLGHDYRLPESWEIETALPLVDYREVETDHRERTIYLSQPGMILELGGIAKGFIVDQALAVLEKEDVESAFVNAGGDIGLIGRRADGNLWQIGIEHPRSVGNLLAVLSLEGQAVVTSGDYARFFEKEGVRYHHILDPNTGEPARGLVQATVVAEKAIDADVLSTALFVLGLQAGLDLLESMPGVEGIMVTEDLEVVYTEGLSSLINLQPHD